MDKGDDVVDGRGRNLEGIADAGALQRKTILLGALDKMGMVRDNLLGASDDDQLLGGNEAASASASQVDGIQLSLLANAAH